MFYRGIGHVGDYCGRIFGHSSYYMRSPWISFVVGALVIALLVALVVVIVKALGKKKTSARDDLLEILKAKYVAGEIDEEEFLRKKKTLGK